MRDMHHSVQLLGLISPIMIEAAAGDVGYVVKLVGMVCKKLAHNSNNEQGVPGLLAWPCRWIKCS